MTTSADTITSLNTLPKRIPSPWLMWFISVTFVIFQFLLQLSAGVMINQMQTSFQLTPLGIGLLASAFYLVYVTLQTPAGMLVDLMGPRRLMTGGGLVCGLGCLIFTTSHGFTSAFIGRLFMGGGASFAFVSSLYISSTWFPSSRFALMLGLAETMGMLGTLFGNVYFASLLQHISWRQVMWFNTGFAFLLGILCWLIIRDNNHSPKTEDTPKHIRHFFQDVMWLMKNPGLFFNGLYTGLIFAVISVFATLWAIPFLSLYQNISNPMATFETSVIFIGLAITCPFMGWLYPKISNKNNFLALFSILAAIITSFITFYTPQSVLIGSLLFVLLGCVCSSYVFNFTLANELVPKHIQTTSVGYTNTLCMITAPLLQPIVGWIIERSSHTAQLTTVYGYHQGLTIIPLCLIGASIICFQIPKPKSFTVKTDELKLKNLNLNSAVETVARVPKALKIEEIS